MSRIEWKSIEDKYEAIGYLAKPGVIEIIEATVPEDKLDKFKEEYKGKYSEEFPYVTKPKSKYGYQFRIYLSDTDGCPSCLVDYLDNKYGNRINDNHFIAELVKEYGFKFTKTQQNSEYIHKCVIEKAVQFEKDYFKGFNVYTNFLRTLSSKLLDGKAIIRPNIVHITSSVNKPTHRNTKKSEIMKTSFTTEQLFRLGWLGEQYVYKLLINRDNRLLKALRIQKADLTEIIWHNEGAIENEKWDDKSIGKGCDIELKLNSRHLYIEVKASKRKNGLFTMTSNEMQKMRDKGDDYYIIKINWLEKIIKNESPDVYVFESPYIKFFKPEKMKEATFRIEGESNE